MMVLTNLVAGQIVKTMLKYQDPLDVLFAALADPARRQIVDQLSAGPASVSELAGPLDMTLPGVVQHIKILESSGLIRSQKQGRVRTCELDVARLAEVESWIKHRRMFWQNALNRLGAVLVEEVESDE